jgi:hypothetical protein
MIRFIQLRHTITASFQRQLSADFHGATISLILASDTAAIILILPLFSPQLFAIIALRVSR